MPNSASFFKTASSSFQFEAVSFEVACWAVARARVCLTFGEELPSLGTS